MALPGDTVGEQLSLLEKILPHHDANGHLYASVRGKNRRTHAATMYLYLTSDEKTGAVHETVYESKKTARTPDEWARWFKRHAFKGSKVEGTAYETLGVIRGAVIPSVNERTGFIWRVHTFLGFSTHDLIVNRHSKIRQQRHKTKSSRRKNGQNNLRRGHRNRKRIAK